MRNIVQIRSIQSYKSINDLVERELTLDESSGTLLLRCNGKVYKYYNSNDIESFISNYFDPKVIWKDTSLGIKLTPESSVEFVELKGKKGDKGDDTMTSINSYLSSNPDSELESLLKLWDTRYNKANDVAIKLSEAFAGVKIEPLSNGFKLIDSNNSTLVEIRDGKLYANGFIVNKKKGEV